ncbi:hypothetical protein BD311DRAFT_678629, partial [Dichomitus squalens]
PSPTAEVESVPLPERVTASSSPTPEGQSPVNHSLLASPSRPIRPGDPIPVLKKNRFGTPPDVCGPWEGKVATIGSLNGFLVTSPTREYIPRYPREVEVIQTYEDGFWGEHEYSRHPQLYVEEMTHLACIPATPEQDEMLFDLFHPLHASRDWTEDRDIAVHGLGLIKREMRKSLGECAAYVIARFEAISAADASTSRYGSFLIMLLRQAVDRMNYLPSVATRSIAVAAHVQRLALELEGLTTYLQVVLPRIESSEDFSHSVLDVVGGFIREGAVTQTWHRVGIPYWVLQPVSSEVAVWRVVQEDALPFWLSTRPCNPPILHRAGTFVGVSNLTGNWVSSMVVSISKHATGSHLARLNLAAVPEVPTSESSSSKRARFEAKDIITKHLTMRPADPVLAASKKSRRQRRRQEGDAPAGDLAIVGSGSAGTSHRSQPSGQSGSTGIQHPSRSLVLSPFVELPAVWAEALRAAGTIPPSPNSALYFFPPPFLLDTVVSAATGSAGCAHPDRARVDSKVNRYLHNLLRIRQFCRTRLFDLSLNNRPLTITEWRAALWGDYLPQGSVRTSGTGADARRAKRRRDERNEIGLLFHKVAHMDSYDETALVKFENRQVDIHTIANDPAIRATLLWEAHEVNFRAELIALDTLLVHKVDWMEIHRWEREMLVSGVWGPPSSAATVTAAIDPSLRVFCWYTPPQEHWDTCRERLRTFARVLTRWPDCPEDVIQASRSELHEDDFREAQRRAVSFYVQTFVSQYSRLPIPPILSAGA